MITDHYSYLLFKTEFLTWMLNSLIISVVATRSRWSSRSSPATAWRGFVPRRRLFGTAVFITYLVPPTLLFLPLSQVVVWLGISDSIWALIVTYPTFLVPFSTWLLMGYFRTIPRGRGVRARGRGESHADALRIVLPMAIPGIVCARSSASP